MSAPNEIIQEFLIETHESLVRLDGDLIALESGNAQSATIGSAFRTLHTLKGSAGFLGFPKLESLAHVTESLLSKLRDGKLTATAEIVSGLLASVDAIRRILSVVEQTETDGDESNDELIARLKALTSSEPVPAAPTVKSPVGQAVSMHDQSFALNAADVFDPGLTASVDALSPTEPSVGASEFPTTRGTQSVVSEPAAKTQPTAKKKPRTRRAAAKRNAEPAVTEVSETPTLSDSQIRAALSNSDTAAPQTVSSRVTDSTIRLGVERVDKMMNLVTELVLARNQLLQHPAVQTDSSLASSARNLNLITTELQESVMTMRMQPINNVWATLPRVVRDLSLECGKQVRLTLEGADTELDKTVLEAIKDPLTHLVRNAIDHGIELPDVRTRRGKPAEGTLRLRAYHESGHIHIEITDDGRGIDRDRVKAKAIENGLLTVDQAARLSDDGVLSLIFLQGFSTRDVVSNLSGRGVGMDVVKSHVERIGGSVFVESVLGVGTKLELRIPLTLAIIQALLVTCGDERYAIPQSSMIELIRLNREQVVGGIERIHGAQVHRYRGKLLPLVSLSEVLGVANSECSESVTVVVVQTEQQSFGLIVDRVNDTQEIVVKPLHKVLRGISCLAGSTILGDGRVALILDITGLAERALGDARTLPAEETSADSVVIAKDSQQAVVVRGPLGERLAIPLTSVARLEVFPANKIEWTGERPVIQYRGDILPLVDLMRLLDRSSSAADAEFTSEETERSVRVVVCTDGRARVGLIVGQIDDVIDDALEVRAASAREHVMFSAVVQNQITEVLNVDSLISLAEAHLIRGGKA